MYCNQEKDGRQLEWLMTNSTFVGLKDKVAIFQVKMKTVLETDWLEKRVIGSASHSATRYILVIGASGAGEESIILSSSILARGKWDPQISGNPLVYSTDIT